jgi:hypothetical protein
MLRVPLSVQSEPESEWSIGQMQLIVEEHVVHGIAAQLHIRAQTAMTAAHTEGRTQHA